MSYYDNKTHVSNSMLNWLDRSEQYFLYRLFRQGEDDESKYLKNGKLLHSYIENKRAFVVSDIVRPGEKTALFLETYHKTGDLLKAKDVSALSYTEERLMALLKDPKNIEYLDFLKSADTKICLTKDQKVTIDGAITALNNNTFCSKLLLIDPNLAKLHNLEIFNELEIYFETTLKDDNNKPSSITIKRKGKLDRLIVDHDRKQNIIIDLKTTSDNPFGKFIKIEDTGYIQKDYLHTGWFNSYINYGYYRQASYYVDAITAHLNNNYETKFYFVVVQLEEPFPIAVYEQSQKHSELYGKKDVDDLLIKYYNLMKNVEGGIYNTDKILTIT